jgi:predicted metal-dependent phosphoesterase TrpH
MGIGQVDLHLHTHFSDGECSPSVVVRMAADCGMKLIAITDHETIGGLAEASAAAQAARLAFIPGIEINTASEHEQHILGYFIDPEKPAILDACAHYSALRRARMDHLLRDLTGQGVPLTLQQVERQSTGGHVGRLHVAAALVAAGHADSIEEAFRRYLSGASYRRVPRPRPSAEEGIAAIRAAGGCAVLAHPHSLRLSLPELGERLAALKAMGLVGLECHYNCYGPEMVNAYMELAERHDLIVTGGSDFHGPSAKPGVEVGRGKNGAFQFGDLDVFDRLRAVAGR